MVRADLRAEEASDADKKNARQKVRSGEDALMRIPVLTNRARKQTGSQSSPIGGVHFRKAPVRSHQEPFLRILVMITTMHQQHHRVSRFDQTDPRSSENIVMVLLVLQ
jgi:hypothetical protein